MPHDADVEAFIRDHFRDTVPPDRWSETIRQLNLDSLDLVEFVMMFEDAFRVEISAEAIDLDRGLEQFIPLARPARASA